MLVYKSFPNHQTQTQIEYPQIPQNYNNQLQYCYSYGNNERLNNQIMNSNSITTARNNMRIMYCLNQNYIKALNSTRIVNGIPLKDESNNYKAYFPDLLRAFDYIRYYNNYKPPAKLNIVLPPINTQNESSYVIKHKNINTNSSDISSVTRLSNTPQYKTKSKWWKLLQHFIHIYTFFSFIKKYKRQSTIRKHILHYKRKFLPHNSTSTRTWLLSLLKEFFETITEYSNNHNLSFVTENINSSTKQQNSQLILSTIKTFMECLISRTSQLSLIPENIQDILYEIIKTNSFHLKQYMTLYMARRLYFSVYGSVINLNTDQISFLLSYVIIGGYIVQDTLINRRVDINSNNTKEGKFLKENMIVIGSILYYMMKEEFEKKVVKKDDTISMINYYRSYHISNKKVKELIGEDGMCKERLNNGEDKDEYEKGLVKKEDVLEFWEMNEEFVKDYKKFIYDWGCKLGDIVKKMYLKKEKGGEGFGDGFVQRIRRPRIVTMTKKVKRKMK